jgi:hypothetical protein
MKAILLLALVAAANLELAPLVKLVAVLAHDSLGQPDQRRHHAAVILLERQYDIVGVPRVGDAVAGRNRSRALLSAAAPVIS